MTGAPSDPTIETTTPPVRAGWLSGFRSRWALVSLATLIYWLGPQSVRLFYALQLEKLGASDFVIGIGVGAGSVAGLLLAVPSGYLLDKVNSRLVLVATTLLLGLSTGAFAFVESVPLMVALMFLQGMCQMWVWLVLQSMITRVGTGQAATAQLSLFSLAWGIGLAAGPSLGAWIYDERGFDVLSLGCGGFVLAGAAASMFVPDVLSEVPTRADEEEDAPRAGMFSALRRAGGNHVVIAVMVASFVNIYVQSIRLSFYPVYLKRAGLSVGVIGLLLSAIGVASLVVRVFLPWTVRRWGQVRPLLVSTWIAIVGIALTPVSNELTLLFAAAVMIGCGLGANPPITVNLLADAGGKETGVAVALRMVANRSAQVVQPLVFGALAGAAGLAIAFPISGGILALGAVWMARRLRHVAPSAPHT